MRRLGFLAALLLLCAPGRAELQAAHGSQAHAIPRAIYTFWDGPLPQLVQHTLDTWHTRAPDWEVHVISRARLRDYVDEAALPTGWSNLGVLQLSDLIRLEVLAARGGVWMDASLALVEPLEAWVPEVAEDGALIGFDLDFSLLQAKEVSPSGADWAQHFHANGSLSMQAIRAAAAKLSEAGGVGTRVFESWAFAAPRGCQALELWRDEFRRAVAADGGPRAYCEQLVGDPASGEFLHPGLRRWLPYLTIHATLARVRHQHRNLAIRTHGAEDAAFSHLNYQLSWGLVWVQGPSNYILDGTGGGVLALGRGRGEEPGPPRLGWIVKLRSIDRTAFECLVAYRAYAPDSPFAAVFGVPDVPRVWPVRLMRYAAAAEARFGPTNDRFLVACFAVARAVVGAMLAVAEAVDGPLGRGTAVALLVAVLLILLRYFNCRRHLKLT